MRQASIRLFQYKKNQQQQTAFFWPRKKNNNMLWSWWLHCVHQKLKDTDLLDTSLCCGGFLIPLFLAKPRRKLTASLNTFTKHESHFGEDEHSSHISVI